MTAGKVRIVSDGTPGGTHVTVYNEDMGAYMALQHITKIEFEPLSVGVELLQVKITIAMPEIDVIAQAVEPQIQSAIG